MRKPSKETPEHPKGFGELLPRPEALQVHHLEASCRAEPKAKPGPARRNGSGPAEEPTRGRTGPGVLPALGDPAPPLPHHHGHLSGGPLVETDAQTDGERELPNGEQGRRGYFGRDAGDERRGTGLSSEIGAELLSAGRAEKEMLIALDRATSEPFFGPRGKEMAFSWRWAEALVC